MTREKPPTQIGRRRADAILGTAGTLPPHVTVLPRLRRDYPTWADLLGSYARKPVEPGKVLAFAPPPRTSRP